MNRTLTYIESVIADNYQNYTPAEMRRVLMATAEQAREDFFSDIGDMRRSAKTLMHKTERTMDKGSAFLADLEDRREHSEGRQKASLTRAIKRLKTHMANTDNDAVEKIITEVKLFQNYYKRFA